MSQEQDRLLEIFAGLGAEGQAMLLSYAEFLAGRAAGKPPAGPAAVPEPRPIAPAEDETVVAAIRRLSESYYMLDKSKVLHETSALMSEHMLQGRDRVEVIEELELVFRRHYERLCAGGEG